MAMVAALDCSARDAQSYDRVGKIVIDRKKLCGSEIGRNLDCVSVRSHLFCEPWGRCTYRLSVHMAAPVDLASAPTKSPKCLTNSTLTPAMYCSVLWLERVIVTLSPGSLPQPYSRNRPESQNPPGNAAQRIRVGAFRSESPQHDEPH